MTLDKETIKKIIPHRSPILLADSAKIQDGECVTSYYVDPEMDVLKGHFPDGAVFPGAYILEAMAQCADILLLSDGNVPEGRPLLFSVQNLRYLRPVLPGTELICRASVSAHSEESSIYEFRVSAFTGDVKAASGIISICLG